MTNALYMLFFLIQLSYGEDDHIIGAGKNEFTIVNYPAKCRFIDSTNSV